MNTPFYAFSNYEKKKKRELNPIDSDNVGVEEAHERFLYYVFSKIFLASKYVIYPRCKFRRSRNAERAYPCMKEGVGGIEPLL